MRTMPAVLTSALALITVLPSVATADDPSSDTTDLVPAWVRVGDPIFSAPRDSFLRFAEVLFEDGLIRISYPSRWEDAGPSLAAELSVGFSEPDAVLTPGQEQAFDIEVRADVTDEHGQARALATSAYLHMNGRGIVEGIVGAGVYCGDNVDADDCVLNDRGIASASLTMPRIFPGYVENGNRVQIGVGAANCASCWVGYEYEAQLVSADVADGTVPGTRVAAPGAGEPDGAPPGGGSELPPVVISEPVQELPGAPDEPAAANIPRIIFEPRADDYSADLPGLIGLPASYNTALVVPVLDATVADINALLSELDATVVGSLPGVAGEAQGILILRLPTSDHDEMTAVIETLDRDPIIEVAVQDTLLGSDAQPKPSNLEIKSDDARRGSLPWSWELSANDPADIFQDGNWGLEVIRAPQMWNLNPAIRKSGLAEEGVGIMTGVFDTGFGPDHVNLKFAQTDTGGRDEYHGTHVAGTIGASHDDDPDEEGVGVDGVDPFARLVAKYYGVVDTSGTEWTTRVSAADVFTNSLADLTRGREDIVVVNISLGFKWSTIGVDADTSARAQEIVEDSGEVYALIDRLDRADQRHFGFSDTFLVVSSGNDSRSSKLPFGGDQDAKWNSPFAWAALEPSLAIENILVAEAIDRSERRWRHANPGGHLSAPGVNILSTTWHPTWECGKTEDADGNPRLTSCYQYLSGTSMAAPHITGLIGYLYKLDPGLSHAQIRELLVRNSKPVDNSGPAADGAPRIDAFASVMDIDRLRGTDGVRRLLLDIDDGTPDGNKRTGEFSDEEDADDDGGVGDVLVDMSDFRRWRDWLLVTEGLVANLDGPRDSAKLDVNANGRFDGRDENVFPRGDFNGDGRISRADRSTVPGRVGDVDMTDLEVLQSLFADPHYAADDLDRLLDSWDLEVSEDACRAHDDVAQVRSWIEVTGSGRAQGGARLHEPGAREIYTVPAADSYELHLEGLDDAGAVVRTARVERLRHQPGHDRLLGPDCDETADDPDAVAAPPAAAGATIDQPATGTGDWVVIVYEEITEGAAVCGGTAADEVKVNIYHRIVYEAFAPMARAEAEIDKLNAVDRPSTWTAGGCGASRTLMFEVSVDQAGLSDDDVRAYFDVFVGSPELFTDGSGPLKAWLIGDQTGQRTETKGAIWAETAAS